jgi:type IV secretory pathway VirJ component
MTMHGEPPSRRSPAPAGRARRYATRILPSAGILIASTTLLACSSSSRGLIPASDAQPLLTDFEAVAAAAQSGDGNCSETAGAIRKTEQDFAALPTSVASNLRNTLSTGISNLSTQALARCAQTTSRSTTTTTTSTTTETTTTSTTIETTTTTTTLTASTTTGAGGGTPAPGDPAPGPG